MGFIQYTHSTTRFVSVWIYGSRHRVLVVGEDVGQASTRSSLEGEISGQFCESFPSYGQGAQSSRSKLVTLLCKHLRPTVPLYLWKEISKPVYSSSYKLAGKYSNFDGQSSTANAFKYRQIVKIKQKTEP